MKQLIWVLGIGTTMMLSFSSCSKCYTCDFNNGRGPQQFCPKDFPDGYAGEKLTIDAYQQRGYTCVAD